MKRYVKSANWLTNKATQLYSKKFDENEILVRTLLGRHNGSPMLDVFFNIMTDPNIQIEDPQRQEGPHNIFYNGKNIGWLDFQRGMGWIDDKAYDKVQKLDPEMLGELRNMWTNMIVQGRLGGGNPMGGNFGPMGGAGGFGGDRLEIDDGFGGYLD